MQYLITFISSDTLGCCKFSQEKSIFGNFPSTKLTQAQRAPVALLLQVGVPCALVSCKG